MLFRGVLKSWRRLLKTQCWHYLTLARYLRFIMMPMGVVIRFVLIIWYWGTWTTKGSFVSKTWSGLSTSKASWFVWSIRLVRATGYHMPLTTKSDRLLPWRWNQWVFSPWKLSRRKMVILAKHGKEPRGCNQTPYLDYFVQDGCLFRRIQLHLPKGLMMVNIIQDLHNGGHFGEYKMLVMVKECYCWPWIVKNISKVVETCRTC